MNIRQGIMADLPSIMDIVKETVVLMELEENDQWTGEYPQRDHFAADIASGTLFVAKNEQGKLVGSITVDQEEPAPYAKIDWRQSYTKPFIFHRLAVDVHERGAGVASKLIRFAEGYALTRGTMYMKTDTYSLNKKAQRLFEKLGYVKVGTMLFQGKGEPFYCYDKLLQTTDSYKSSDDFCTVIETKFPQ
ncbi:GNAT family N-acetyltransferase [Bacillus fonticola]|uniref:GNAT family N-acetyltransferase n=1 Tax=Bacillus fonticola TaxID=2728853 RepID=UPI0014754C48|nr:GNAT family N-acetyltransferase [Bacillus fonticola]